MAKMTPQVRVLRDNGIATPTYNDRMRDGGRSLKWGYTPPGFSIMKAKQVLEDAGYVVEHVVTPKINNGFMPAGGEERLHVSAQ